MAKNNQDSHKDRGLVTKSLAQVEARKRNSNKGDEIQKLILMGGEECS
jgi:hypothetical protein